MTNTKLNTKQLNHILKRITTKLNSLKSVKDDVVEIKKDKNCVLVQTHLFTRIEAKYVESVTERINNENYVKDEYKTSKVISWYINFDRQTGDAIIKIY